MQVDLTLTADYKDIAPICRVCSSITSQTFRLDQKQNSISTEIQFKNEDSINIEFVNKDDNDDNTVEILKVKLDGIDLQHFIYEGSFSPIYNKEWFEKQNPKPPLIYSPCTELRHNGTWSLNIKLPVWKMIMNKWIADER
jgi:hypothetical protein